MLGLFGGTELFWPFTQLSAWPVWWDVKGVFLAFMLRSACLEPGSFRMGRLSYCSCWLSGHPGSLYHRCRSLSSLSLCGASARHTGHRAHCHRDWRAIHTVSHSQTYTARIVRLPWQGHMGIPLCASVCTQTCPFIGQRRILKCVALNLITLTFPNASIMHFIISTRCAFRPW